MLQERKAHVLLANMFLCTVATYASAHLTISHSDRGCHQSSSESGRGTAVVVPSCLQCTESFAFLSMNHPIYTHVADLRSNTREALSMLSEVSGALVLFPLIDRFSFVCALRLLHVTHLHSTCEYSPA